MNNFLDEAYLMRQIYDRSDRGKKHLFSNSVAFEFRYHFLNNDMKLCPTLFLPQS